MAKTIEERHPSIQQAMRGLWFTHLAPGELRDFSQLIHDTVVELVDRVNSDDPQLTIAIHKAVEFKDAMVRAKVYDIVAAGNPKPVNATGPDGELVVD